MRKKLSVFQLLSICSQLKYGFCLQKKKKLSQAQTFFFSFKVGENIHDKH